MKTEHAHKITRIASSYTKYEIILNKHTKNCSHLPVKRPKHDGPIQQHRPRINLLPSLRPPQLPPHQTLWRRPQIRHPNPPLSHQLPNNTHLHPKRSNPPTFLPNIQHVLLTIHRHRRHVSRNLRRPQDRARRHVNPHQLPPSVTHQRLQPRGQLVDRKVGVFQAPEDRPVGLACGEVKGGEIAV